MNMELETVGRREVRKGKRDVKEYTYNLTVNQGYFVFVAGKEDGSFLISWYVIKKES